MLELVENLRRAYGERIDALTWMSAETKVVAREKLATFLPKIGYPDSWRDYSDFEVRAGDAFGNRKRGAVYNWRYDVARLGRPTDKTEWLYMDPQDVNAYYNPVFNEIVFPAAILQPPFFDPNADPAVNYGAIGGVIGHEMGHGFDDQGAEVRRARRAARLVDAAGRRARSRSSPARWRRNTAPSRRCRASTSTAR